MFFTEKSEHQYRHEPAEEPPTGVGSGAGPSPCRQARTAPVRASELLHAHAERFRRKRDDGRAEAALMALWGLTNLPGLGLRAALPVSASDVAAVAT
jgi:hypothetical protein